MSEPSAFPGPRVMKPFMRRIISLIPFPCGMISTCRHNVRWSIPFTPILWCLFKCDFSAYLKSGGESGVGAPGVFPMFLAFCSLLGMVILLWRISTPSISLLVAILFSLSFIFFETTHIARPEFVIFLVFVGNLLWESSQSDRRWVAALAGSSFAFCFYIHPNLIIPLSAFLFLALGCEGFSIRRLLGKPKTSGG